MKRLGYVFAVIVIVVVAVWTYQVKYETTAALGRIEELRDRIAATKERIRVFRVEWAWLNAPERLAALVARHNDRLGLVPLGSGAFARVSLVPFPPRGLPAPVPEGGAETLVVVRYPPPPGMPVPPARPVREAGGAE